MPGRPFRPVRERQDSATNPIWNPTGSPGPPLGYRSFRDAAGRPSGSVGSVALPDRERPTKKPGAANRTGLNQKIPNTYFSTKAFSIT